MAQKGIMEIGGLGMSLFGAFFALVGFMRTISSGNVMYYTHFSWAMVGVIIMLLGISFMIFGKR